MAALDESIAESSLTCFIIGPIGNKHAEIGSPDRVTYEESLGVMAEVIEPACAHHALTAVRADTLGRPGEITEQIFRRLSKDDVVIADVTGANANVMYELGLRHTRDKLTVQLGEYGRLPFDVNTIRTIQFSRSAIGLIHARDELIQVLAAGLGGDYDPVTATRVWNETASPTGTAVPDDTAENKSDDQSEGDSQEATERGFLDIMVEAEEQGEALPEALAELAECVGAMGELAQQTTDQMSRSDSAGKGMRGRLQVATKYADNLNSIAVRLEAGVDHYMSVLTSVSGGSLALIAAMEEDPEALAEGQEFGLLIRQMAAVTRDSMANLAGMVESIKATARLSRVLKEPSRRAATALDRFVEATSIIDEWDRRLQSLGVPIPPEDWEPDASDDQGADEHAASANDSSDDGGSGCNGTAKTQPSEGDRRDEDDPPDSTSTTA